MYPLGVIHGRFQGLHNVHLEYLLAGKSRCRFLYIGITNPDPALTKDAIEDPNRSKDDANPFTYYERLEMTTGAMLEAGISRSEFEIVPFPITHPHLIRYYAPPDAVYFMTIYDDWGRAKAASLKELGLTVEVMWDRPLSEKRITGTDVRKLIVEGGQWERLVPQSVANYIIEHNLATRLPKHL